MTNARCPGGAADLNKGRHCDWYRYPNGIRCMWCTQLFTENGKVVDEDKNDNKNQGGEESKADGVGRGEDKAEQVVAPAGMGGGA